MGILDTFRNNLIRNQTVEASTPESRYQIPNWVEMTDQVVSRDADDSLRNLYRLGPPPQPPAGRTSRSWEQHSLGMPDHMISPENLQRRNLERASQEALRDMHRQAQPSGDYSRAIGQTSQAIGETLDWGMSPDEIESMFQNLRGTTGLRETQSDDAVTEQYVDAQSVEHVKIQDPTQEYIAGDVVYIPHERCLMIYDGNGIFAEIVINVDANKKPIGITLNDQEFPIAEVNKRGIKNLSDSEVYSEKDLKDMI